MPGTPFTVDIRRGDDTVLVLGGDVNRGAQAGLEGAYADAEGGPGRLVLDFETVDFINSTGIAVIVGILAKARAAGREVVAVGLSDHYREVFRITRLSDFMLIS
jgi:anti-sigma B factor antagonist